MPRSNLIRTLVGRFRCLHRDARAATAVEYGLLLGVIALTLAAALSNVSGGLNNVYNTVTTKIDTAK